LDEQADARAVRDVEVETADRGDLSVALHDTAEANGELCCGVGVHVLEARTEARRETHRDRKTECFGSQFTPTACKALAAIS